MTRVFDVDNLAVRVLHQSYIVWLTVSARLKKILISESADWAELQTGVMFVVWGIWFLTLHLSHVTGLKSSIWAIQVLSEVAPITFWGVGFIVLGAATLYGVLLDVMKLRKFIAFISFIWWLELFLICLSSATLDAVLTIPTTLVFALSSAWCHVRLVRHAAMVDHLTYRG